MNEQFKTIFGKRTSQMLTMTYSNEVKFLYQVEEEDDTQLLNADMRFLTGVEQVIKTVVFIVVHCSLISVTRFGDK